MNIYWCIHANFCPKPNLTTKLGRNSDEIQTNSLVAETTSCGWRWLTDRQTPLLFQLPIWRMMATPSFNVPSYKTSHDWLWDPSQPASPCIFCSIVDLTSLYLLPYFTIIRPQLSVFAGGLFKYYSREQYLILVYIYAQNNDGSMQK